MIAYASLKDRRYNYGYKGFTSIITQFIDIAKMHYELSGNLQVFVDDPQILGLFDRKISISEESKIYDAGFLYLERFFSNQIDCKFNAHTLANDEDLNLRSMIFNSILQMKSEKIHKFKSIRDKIIGNERVLGVQARGTDKKTEIARPQNSNILRHIDQILSKDDSITKIFLATDDSEYLNELSKAYGSNLVFNDSNIVSSDGGPIHYGPERSKLNEQVLSDVYILSTVDHFLYSFSNVSQLALILGVDNHLDKTNLNLEINS